MPTTRPVLRCFPRADRAFQAEAERLVAAWLTELPSGVPEPEAFQAYLQERYPSATVRPQDRLAAFEPDSIVWYVYRREEPVATVDGGKGDGATSNGAAPAAGSSAEAREAREAGGPGSAPVYSAGRVAEMIGVPVSVLIGWSEVDGLVRPARTSSGLALYSRNNVETLLAVKRAFARGQSVDDVRTSLGAPAATSGARSAAGANRRLLVLLAERDPYAAEFSEYFLRTEGYEVEVALSALEAEARALELLPDLAVVELLISGGAGTELCARLKVRPEAKVLAISTLDFEDGALRAGADAFLAKPFDPLAFVSTVKDLLGESAMLRGPATASAATPAAGEAAGGSR